MAKSKIEQLRTELAKTKPSNFYILSSSCTISYHRIGKEYWIYANNRLISCYYSYESLMSAIKQLQEYEQYQS